MYFGSLDSPVSHSPRTATEMRTSATYHNVERYRIRTTASTLCNIPRRSCRRSSRSRGAGLGRFRIDAKSLAQLSCWPIDSSRRDQASSVFAHTHQSTRIEFHLTVTSSNRGSKESRTCVQERLDRTWKNGSLDNDPTLCAFSHPVWKSTIVFPISLAMRSQINSSHYYRKPRIATNISPRLSLKKSADTEIANAKSSTCTGLDNRSHSRHSHPTGQDSCLIAGP